MNKPQLSAELGEKFYTSFGSLIVDDNGNVITKKIEAFLATALEDQRVGYIAEVEKLIDNEEDDTTAWLYNSAINKVLAILNGKDTNE